MRLFVPLTVLSMLAIFGCSSSSLPRHPDATTDSGSDATPDASTDSPVSQCTGTEMFFDPGCGSEADPTAITPGCYQPCTGAGDPMCRAGTRCALATVDPGEPQYDVCGVGTLLCLPGPYELDDLDDECDGSIAGQDVLDLVRTRYDLALTYADDNTTSPATLELSYDDGSIRCHPAIPSGPGMGVPPLPARVELTVALHFTTPDGSFAEQRVTSLSAMHEFATATFHAEIPIEDFAGSFEPSLMGAAVARLRIAGDLTLDTANGQIMVDSMAASPTAPTQTRSVASWTAQ